MSDYSIESPGFPNLPDPGSQPNIAWAIFREGTAERWVRRDVETLLAPYRP